MLQSYSIFCLINVTQYLRYYCVGVVAFKPFFVAYPFNKILCLQSGSIHLFFPDLKCPVFLSWCFYYNFWFDDVIKSIFYDFDSKLLRKLVTFCRKWQLKIITSFACSKYFLPFSISYRLLFNQRLVWDLILMDGLAPVDS